MIGFWDTTRTRSLAPLAGAPKEGQVSARGGPLGRLRWGLPAERAVAEVSGCGGGLVVRVSGADPVARSPVGRHPQKGKEPGYDRNTSASSRPKPGLSGAPSRTETGPGGLWTCSVRVACRFAGMLKYGLKPESSTGLRGGNCRSKWRSLACQNS